MAEPDKRPGTLDNSRRRRWHRAALADDDDIHTKRDVLKRVAPRRDRLHQP